VLLTYILPRFHIPATYLQLQEAQPCCLQASPAGHQVKVLQQHAMHLGQRSSTTSHA
jgi:hypothetical protein